MSGTRKMGKFELEAFVREQLEGAATPGATPASGEIAKADVAGDDLVVDSKKATAKIAKMELPAEALPTGGEFKPQPIAEHAAVAPADETLEEAPEPTSEPLPLLAQR